MKFVDIKGGRAPVLGLGTARLYGSECVRVVRTALDLGYRHIETAELYTNERFVGEAVALAEVERAEIFLTTKIWTNRRAAHLRRAAEASLRNLRTDYVDLLLVHRPNKSVALSETLRALTDLLEEGKARTIGVSNFPARLRSLSAGSSARTES